MLENPGRRSVGDRSDRGGNCHSLESGTVACLCVCRKGLGCREACSPPPFLCLFSFVVLGTEPRACHVLGPAFCLWATTQPTVVFSLFICVAPGSEESVLSYHVTLGWAELWCSCSGSWRGQCHCFLTC